MRVPRFNARRRLLATRWLLGLLLLRAYVPAGFMPQSGNPLALEICPAGMSMPMSMPEPAQHPAQTADHVADCPFGHSPVDGPITTSFNRAASAPAFVRSVPPCQTRPMGVRLLHVHQARAPPAAAA